ncbi:hypothetical protein KIN20_008392 [Parelaphostrongylus tenuis]|uniref:Tyrosine-protein phosphatase domain-containing protein n=1 Tax=Parelaphostrongylus tenuis TaxID=148309 RepID=A0AAD5MMS9_PARTN|nr:hypothetical protein KIN20_008392 [Parelaphostrongylus tenuis]
MEEYWISNPVNGGQQHHSPSFSITDYRYAGQSGTGEAAGEQVKLRPKEKLSNSDNHNSMELKAQLVKRVDHEGSFSKLRDDEGITFHDILLCIDSTCVVLKWREGDCDYINANWTEVEDQEKKFISTQEKCKSIIMLCDVTECRKPECEQYWPLTAESPVMSNNADVAIRHPKS